MKFCRHTSLAWAGALLGLLAVLCPVQGRPKLWTGATNPDWNGNANNWSPSGIPAATDDVYIASSAAPRTNALLTASATVLSLTISNGAALTVSNWSTVLSVTNVYIKSGGNLTLPTFFTNGVMSNRLYLVCSNLTVEAGGRIDASGRGFGCGTGPGAGTNYSYGVPGFQTGSGGGYGGKGEPALWSYLGYIIGNAGGQPYGAINLPLDPGSGGGSSPTNALIWTAYGDDRGGAGGGAVRIEASGTVTLDGSILADGMDGGKCTPTNINIYGGGGGSGGGVYAACKTFVGTSNGLISANGGATPAYRQWYYWNGAGSGGRIAVVYQNAAFSNGFRFSTSPGAGWTSNVESRMAFAPEKGTVYLSDRTVLGTNLTGRLFTDVSLYISGMTSWAVGSLTVSNCSVTFATNGFQLTVTNDLRIDKDGVLGIGTWGAPSNGVLSCPGNLILTNGGSLYVYSGTTNAAGYGALVSVTNLIIGPSSWIYPYANPTNGGTVLFRLSNLTIAATGGINANGKGYAFDKGPGRGMAVAIPYPCASGGGYGGKGGEGPGRGAWGGGPYGIESNAVEAGSGAWDDSIYLAVGPYAPYQRWGASGGGAVRIAASGTVTVDGTITANGTDGGLGDYSLFYYAGASGGGIDIVCQTFGGRANGVLQANGGGLIPWAPDGRYYTSAGGGGRIAVKYAGLASTHDVHFSAAGGTGWAANDPTNQWTHAARMGTLYLPNTNLLSTTLANNQFNGVRLFIPGFTNWSVDSLTISNCNLSLPNGICLNVTNDLRIDAGGVLSLESVDVSNCTLNVGGNLSLLNGGALHIYSGRTNGATGGYGALVNVAKDVTIGASSWLYLYCHETNGGAPLLVTRDVTINDGGGISADARGFASGWKGWGAGGGTATVWGASWYGSGGGYGGKGGDVVPPPAVTGGVAYGWTNVPALPGSGGGTAYTNAVGRGGGVVRIDASGAVTLNGTITANGGHPMGYPLPYEWEDAGGSGGGILISCATFGGGIKGVLRANGAEAPRYDVAGTYETGAGGGGRIAIWQDLPDDTQTNLFNTGTAAGIYVTNIFLPFLGAVSAEAGLGSTNFPPGGAADGSKVLITYGLVDSATNTISTFLILMQ